MTEKIDYLDLHFLCQENKEEGEEIMTFNWKKAARLILDHNIKNAEAFIRGDEARTAGRIIDDGQVIADHQAILESYIDEPTLRDTDTQEEWSCYTTRPSTNWTAESILLITGETLEDHRGLKQ